ncbi:MAG: hypothetical protein F6K53_06285 [Moorea sp. SIO4A1]|nr:hypothetical protein [Moorena sp. SIO4A5]NEQ57038.1 hypothetical protein [Moorena sp. SIO4A1]
MSKMTTSTEIENLQKICNLWNQRIEDVIKEMSFTSELDQLENLDRKFQYYSEQLKKFENKLNLLKTKSDSSASPNPQHTISNKISKINFHNQKKIVNYILDNCLGEQGGLALFLLDNTSLMRGDLCVAEIQYYLSSKSYGKLKYCPIDPFLRPDISDERSLLNAIADYFKPIEPHPNDQQYIHKIIEKIGDSVQGGSIVFFYFTNWDSLTENDDRLLSWFIEYFWKSLKQKHQDISQDYSWVKFLLFCSISSIIPESYQKLSYCCNYNDFDSLKIIKLPLSKWKESDIDHWLQQVYGLSKPKSKKIARTIYKSSNRGIPSTVCSKLEQYLAKLVKE